MSDEENPLALFTTEELFAEIDRRHTHVLAITVKDYKLASENADVIDRHTKGPSWALLGLCEVYRSWASLQYVDNSEAGEDDDE